MKESTFTDAEERMIEQEFEALLNDYAQTKHRQKTEIITKAYLYAKEAHNGVRRRSGEPYMMHPLAVARIVVKEIGLGSTSICSALLHDVVEDTDTTIEDIRSLFGDKVALIVDGLTKISGGVFGSNTSKQAENFRKLILTMSEDIRVILIKIADRLHNMRTLEYQPKEKQYKIAGETQYIYAPLAHRLGLFPIKSELENLSFKYEHPDLYNEIQQNLNERMSSEMESFERFAAPIRNRLTELGYNFRIEARIKTPYSIWKKMQEKNVGLDYMYDLLAVRIVFEPDTISSEKDQCWRIYSTITDIYTVHPSRIRDWISSPKANGYEALHITVMGPEGYWIEVQIRTTRMHEIAEKGLAAHWKYKMGDDDDSQFGKWLQDIREFLNDPDANAMDFLEKFKLTLFASEVCVYTPQGEVKILPLGASTLDFAFMLHSELGEHCIGAKVNHKLQQLNYRLSSGDQIEILTSTNQHPTKEWYDWVVTAKAKARLQAYFKKEDRQFQRLGERLLDEELSRLGKREMRDTAIHRLLNYYSISQQSEMMRQLGRGNITISPLEVLLKKKKKWWQYLPFTNSSSSENEDNNSEAETKIENKDKKRLRHVVLTDEKLEKEYTLAPCCHPIPGDEILAYNNGDGTFVIHKINCPEANKLKASFGKNICTAEWHTHRIKTYKEVLEITGFDNKGVILKVFEIISQAYKSNLSDVHITAEGGVFFGRLQLEVFDTAEIEQLCHDISEIPEIQNINRLQR